jgi:hypothetical protein
VTHSTIGTDENQIVCNERIAVETRLVAVLFDVVAPTLQPGLPVEGIEAAGARADKYQIPGDRRSGPDSTTGFKLPQNSLISRLGKARGAANQSSKS